MGLVSSDRVNLPCLDLHGDFGQQGAVVALRGGSIEPPCRHAWRCLGEQAAEKLAADLYAFLNHHLSELVAAERNRLGEVDARLRTITEHQRQYLAHADLARAIAAVPGKAAAALSHPLFDPEMMPPVLAVRPCRHRWLSSPIQTFGTGTTMSSSMPNSPAAASSSMTSMDGPSPINSEKPASG